MLVALPQPAGCWSCPSPCRAPCGAALVGAGGLDCPTEGPAHLETVKSPKTRGFWGSRVRRRKTSSAKRGVEVRHPRAGAPVQRMQVGILGACWREQAGWSCIAHRCRQGCALTQLVEVGLGALRPRDGAHQAGLQERAPAVDEAALPSNIVLPGTKSQDQSSLSESPPLLCPPRSHRETPPALSLLPCGRCAVTPSRCSAWDAPCSRAGKSPPPGTTGHRVLALATDLADPGHPGVDVPPLPLPSFHGHLTEENVDFVIVRVVGIRDGVGTNKRGLCGRRSSTKWPCALTPPCGTALKALGNSVRC